MILLNMNLQNLSYIDATNSDIPQKLMCHSEWCENGFEKENWERTFFLSSIANGTRVLGTSGSLCIGVTLVTVPALAFMTVAS